MNTSDENEFQVVVAGAGPVGMAVAIELGLRGIRTLVCDPRGPVEYNVARINLTNARSMEHFRRWGIADKLRENDPIPSDVVRDLTYVTRANGRIILNVEGAYEWREQPSFAAEVPEWAPHHAIEKTLREKILSIPAVTFMPFTTIKDFTQDSEGVTLTYEDQSGDCQDFRVWAGG
ncbi:FAD-dependent monooxygenase [Sphingobium fluviale]|uniref:FAD-binding domain-containing protein n=1 Tax=Sphingobium fluviale TaxID=2506423 RepID=A0A4Q1KHA9_9SPHN|nr:FAD-dependent monooxygenase [Sphingobium fluviale]RXR28725.1 hypothetical protein EQG66_08335 [Sphingobium fluviale]